METVEQRRARSEPLSTGPISSTGRTISVRERESITGNLATLLTTAIRHRDRRESASAEFISFRFVVVLDSESIRVAPSSKLYSLLAVIIIKFIRSENLSVLARVQQPVSGSRMAPEAGRRRRRQRQRERFKLYSGQFFFRFLSERRSSSRMLANEREPNLKIRAPDIVPGPN